MSHPLRMRGLKPNKAHPFLAIELSHPLRMRGLKPEAARALSGSINVASFTDAWIETLIGFGKRPGHFVASFTDAWIETCHRLSFKADQ